MERRAFLGALVGGVLAGPLAASTPSAENTRLLGAFQAELTEAKVDLIVAGGTPNALAAREASQTIPIVMVGATTPVKVGLVKTLARPGGNVTGVTFEVSPEQTAKLVELLTEIAGVSRLAVRIS
jgi:putative ABC transport system substrate-binding protein